MAFSIGTDAIDFLGGTSGKDAIAGGKDVDYMYGGGGSDAFVIRLSDMNADLASTTGSISNAQDVIWDFHGAGVYEAGNNDFLYLDGFGSGSTLTFVGYGKNSENPDGDTTAHFYSIHSTNTGLDYIIAVGSINSNQLVLGDYNFYN
ncbi:MULTISPECIES: hypothetical protein [Novosphingobium]|uniref:Hemolysin type calcium-binding protein n=1 Tax=Novosphingobium panipatense TaxID=428991 RepID=A0ABY1QRS7_9SPHN|nr:MULTISPECIES: hypothetical protein [Novosphingobium]SMP78520.1 hypothetical protein SAMN06296065_11140 [Novosphingobium panipatense]